MRFARPEFLWLLLLVPVAAVWLAWLLAGRRRALLQYAGEPLLGRLVRTASLEKMVVKTILLVTASIFLILAAARPQWGSSLQQVARQGVDVLIGIDISESMLAEDIRPNRLQKAIASASGLMDRFAGDRVGLMAFAGSAAVVCPLTLDYNAIRMFLDTLSPDMISYPGTSLTYAIRIGSQAFGAEEKKFKVMILFSDGEDQLDAEETARAAAEAAGTGLVIHTIGMGTPAGAPIPVRGKDGEITGYKKDKDGRVVTTRLDETLLSRISQTTAGVYLPATAAETELDRIAEEISGMDKKELQARLMTQYEERFQVPLALGIAALAAEALLSNRRRLKGIRPLKGSGRPASSNPARAGGKAA